MEISSTKKTLTFHRKMGGDEKDEGDPLHTKLAHRFFDQVDLKGKECISGQDLSEQDLLLAERGLNLILLLYMTCQ